MSSDSVPPAEDRSPQSSRTGVRELRTELAAFIRRAGEGERIIVTVDGQPVAQIGPLQPIGAPTLDDLAAAGMVRLPGRDDRPDNPPTTMVPVDMRPHDVLAELRGDQPGRTTRR